MGGTMKKTLLLISIISLYALSLLCMQQKLLQEVEPTMAEQLIELRTSSPYEHVAEQIIQLKAPSPAVKEEAMEEQTSSLEHAKQYLLHQQDEKAASELHQILQHGNAYDKAEAWLVLGNYWMEHGNKAQALGFWTQAAQQHDNISAQINALLNIGIYSYMHKRYDVAERYLLQVAGSAKYGAQVKAWQYLSMLYRKLGKVALEQKYVTLATLQNIYPELQREALARLEALKKEQQSISAFIMETYSC